MEKLKQKTLKWLKWSEKYTKTDMVYLVKNTSWINAHTIITSILAFMLSIIFARFVEKETYGTYQFLLSISSILGALTLTGMNNAVIQSTARGFDGVFIKSVKTQIKFGAIPFLAGIFASLYYFVNGNQTLSIPILIMAILLPFTNSINTWGAFLFGKKDFKNSFVYGQIINFTYYLGMIVCILLLPKSIPLILTNFVLLFFSNLLVYFIVIKKYKPSEKSEEDAISYGKKLSVSNILPIIAQNIDNIIVFHFMGATELAIYAFASNIPERLGGLIRPISTIAFPKFAEKDPNLVKKIIPQKTLQLFILTSLVIISYIVLSPFIFKIFFPSYLNSVVYSQIYSISIIFALTTSLPFTSILARRSKKIHTLNTIYPLLNIILLSIGGYIWGILGIILSKIISNLFLLGITLYFNKIY